MPVDEGARAAGVTPAAAPMPASLSLLAKITRADVIEEPFPHVIVPDVLDAGLCAQLLQEMPPLETLGQGRPLGSNKRFSYSCHAACADPSVSDTWKRFLREHVSQAFLDEMMRLFGPALRRQHPRFEARCGPIERLRGGVRGGASFAQADVLLDAQMCANTPVLQASSVRGAHIDAPDKLFVGLYYLRHPADDSVGGDLQMYQPRAGSLRWAGRFTSRARFELKRTVPYQHNMLVLFLNSIRSVHLVTVRSPTPRPRLMVNLVGEVQEPLWRYQKRAYDRLQQRLLWNASMVMPWTAQAGERA